MADPWARLTEALDLLADKARTLDFWLRDDDAVEPTGQLDRLLDLTGRHGLPLVLAVIPETSGAELALALQDSQGVSVAVHGWSHRNHALPGEKKQELGRHRAFSTVLGEIAAGKDKLEGLHEGRFVPMLVPPWNRISADLLPGLAPLGYRALSTFGPEPAASGPLGEARHLNTHVDIIDWHGSRGGRPDAVLVAEILGRLTHVTGKGGTVGILAHHLVHDGTAWDFLERLARTTAGHPAVRWRTGPDLLAA